MTNYMNKTKILEDIHKGKILSQKDAKSILSEVLENNTIDYDYIWNAVFSGIQTRGPQQQEIIGFIEAIKDFDESMNSDKLTLDSKVYSITGSGKESFKTFNVSTISAIVASCAGINILKPGSVSTSAVSGAINILKELSIPILQDINKVDYLLNECGLCFIDFSQVSKKYAERYDGKFHYFHPLSYIIPILAIPVKLDGLVYGIADSDVRLSAELCRYYNIDNVTVVNSILDSELSIDEYCPFGNSKIAHISKKNIKERSFPNESFLLNENIIKQKRTHSENAENLIKILSSNKFENIELIEMVAYNTSLILLNANKVSTLSEGVKISKDIIYQGYALEKIQKYKNSFKKMEDLHD